MLAAINDYVLRIDGQEIKLSGSIGVATFTSGWASAEEVMGRADAAMYEAKQKHLGVVVSAGEEGRRIA
jgi:predicted signal transduction protein with EAL and GGDEF domain